MTAHKYALLLTFLTACVGEPCPPSRSPNDPSSPSAAEPPAGQSGGMPAPAPPVKDDMGNMPGMNMPGMNMPGMNMPGMAPAPADAGAPNTDGSP